MKNASITEVIYKMEPATPGVFQTAEFLEAKGAPQKHCILLHGWNSDASAMDAIKGVLMNFPEARNWRFWWLNYDSHLASFKTSAHQLVNLLAAQPYDFSTTVFVAYSMGGLVARQMIASGFPAKALVTICTPHHGVAPWVPTPNTGTQSMAPWSADLAALNNNPTDAAHRRSYHFFGITYSDIRGKHEDDVIVTIGSAMGDTLGDTATRLKIHLDYGNGLAGPDPHWRGMDPNYVKPATSLCQKLFARL